MGDVLDLMGQSEGIGNALLLIVTLSALFIFRYDVLPLFRDKLIPYLQARQERHDKVLADLTYLKSQIEALKYVQGVQDEKLNTISRNVSPCLKATSAILKFTEQYLQVDRPRRDYNRNEALEALTDE